MLTLAAVVLVSYLSTVGGDSGSGLYNRQNLAQIMHSGRTLAPEAIQFQSPCRAFLDKTVFS